LGRLADAAGPPPYLQAVAPLLPFIYQTLCFLLLLRELTAQGLRTGGWQMLHLNKFNAKLFHSRALTFFLCAWPVLKVGLLHISLLQGL